MTILNILLSLLIIAGIILIIYLIGWLKRFEKTINSISSDIKDIHIKTIPLIENLNETALSTSKITREAEKKIDELSEFVNSVREKVSWIKVKQHDIMQKKDYPGEGLLINLRAVSKGIAAFLRNL